MKFPILLVVALFLNKCSDKKSDYFIPKEFQYLKNKIESGKTFIYQNILTKQLAFKSVAILDIQGQDYFITKEFDSASTTDSAISLNGKILEDYNSVLNGGHGMTKENIAEDTVINNGLKLGKHLKNCSFQTPTTTMILNIEDFFVKDTSCIWEGKTLDCLEIQSVAKIQSNILSDTLFNKFLNVSVLMYYAKSVGLVKYIIQFRDHNGVEKYGDWELKEIKDIGN
jgi:hypothetical protein